MKQREKFKNTSPHRPQCAKWFSRYSIQSQEFEQYGRRHFVDF